MLAALLLAGCGGEPTRVVPAGSTSVGPTTQTTSEPAQPTAEGTASARPGDQFEGTAPAAPGDPADGAPADHGPGAASPPAGPTDDGTVDQPSGGQQPGDGGTEGLPGWPIEATPAHGARLWAVYLAVGAPGDPTLQPVLEEVRQLWPGAGLGELGCDDGAAAALGRDGTEHAVAVYFATEQHVSEFRRRWDGPYVGAAHVTTYCAD